MSRFAPCLAFAAALLPLGFSAPAMAASGWQQVGEVTIPTGEAGVQEGFNCPANLPVAHSGAFAMNSVGQTSQVYLSFNGPRIDETTPDFTGWAWHFYWPAGAPAGITIKFDVYCAKK